MSNTPSLFQIFKRKRSDRSSTGSITPEKELLTKKAKESDFVSDIEQETDSILEEGDISLEEMTGKGQAQGLTQDQLFEKISDTIEQKMDKKLREFHTDTKNMLEEMLHRVTKELTALESRVSNLESENNTLKKEIADLRKSQKEQKIEQNHAAQYSRKESIRIWKKQEVNGEDTRECVVDLIKTKLQLKVTKEDISACHRLPAGRHSDNQHRPILVRFRNRYIKEDVIRARKKLKGQQINITDDITRENMTLMDSARKSGYFESVWFYNAKVHAIKKRDAKRVVLELFQDFAKV